ncbi:uncharacterized protein PITG_10220 [Phytophthora infestans T30-4]|uniref:Uncharacterized protein n=1 Tax=Phytophthora infestans (strain T30-4) TaxID=403677 RepID=D0NEM1_PHYIT|nr:uncharacterized protein PITG_10220 [Phytophthora infestans T30-4]EEY56666.1 conserved hypothetical protein [Phytophthora infestans T30-4]|eukprot:XP_002902740.1 conserved hypothetical protein [Phytophthora infestans T30-4]
MSTNREVDDKAFLKNISQDQAKRALERSAAIRADHISAKGNFPASSQGDHDVDSDEANRKRIIYRSKQRGWLERPSTSSTTSPVKALSHIDLTRP